MKLDTIYNGDALEVLKTFPDCSTEWLGKGLKPRKRSLRYD